jgi:hypothetical protein
MGDMADAFDGMPKQPPLNGIIIDQQDMRAHRNSPRVRSGYDHTIAPSAENPVPGNARILAIVPFWALA